MFPLPLTPFERYYWHDDRPGYPTSYAFELTFQGGLHREALEAALAAVYERHPLLLARIESAPRGPQWTAGHPRPSPLDWADADTPIRHPDGSRIDLTRACGLRSWVRTGDGATLLRLQFHHLCADGIAAIRVIEELLIAYDQLVADPGAKVDLPPLDPNRLVERGRLEDEATAAAKTLSEHIRHAFGTLTQWSDHVIRPATPLAVPAGASGEADDDPVLAFTTAAAGGDAFQQIRERARRQGATWNDLLLAELFRTLRAWNEEHGARPGTLRLNMPVSLRGSWDQSLPACNRISFAFVSCSARDRDDDLLSIVRAQTQRIKEERLALYFLGGLGAAFAIPGLVPWFLNRRACFATMVLSNVGRLFVRTPLAKNDVGQVVAGGATLLRIGAAPPVRPLTHAALAVIQYGPEVTFNLRVDPSCLSRREGQQLLDAYLSRLVAGDGRSSQAIDVATTA